MNLKYQDKRYMTLSNGVEHTLERYESKLALLARDDHDKKLLEEMSRLLADHLAQSGGSAELQQVRRILDELSGESR